MAVRIWLTLSWVLFMLGSYAKPGEDDTTFVENYEVVWGGYHVKNLYGGRVVQLELEKSDGSAFKSKLLYTSGFFHMRIKVPRRDSAGVVTAYYLSSEDSGNDELDFEFLGNRGGKPYRLQTNVFTNGKGNREQKIRLWFDPTADFHDYGILWNPYQTVFFVDNVPIRVFKNKTSSGVGYPRKPMKIIGSIWNGDSWATDGGKEKINWSYAPFTACFSGFSVDGCPSGGGCSAWDAWWNSQRFSNLNSAQQQQYENVKRKYMAYDYCSDKSRYPTPPPECPQ